MLQSCCLEERTCPQVVASTTLMYEQVNLYNLWDLSWCHLGQPRLRAKAVGIDPIFGTSNLLQVLPWTNTKSDFVVRVVAIARRTLSENTPKTIMHSTFQPPENLI